jgi:hypothetical protein
VRLQYHVRPGTNQEEVYSIYIYIFVFRYICFWTHGNCRYGHLFFGGIFIIILNFEILDRVFLQKVIYGPYGSYFLVKSPYMDRTDHTFLVESPCMDQQSVYFWKSISMDRQSVLFWKKSIYMDRQSVYITCEPL